MTPEKLRDRRRLRQQMAVLRMNQQQVALNEQMLQRHAQDQRIAEAQLQATLDRILGPFNALLRGF